MKHIETIRQVKNLLKTVRGIELAMVYGSYARGDFNPNSDLDIHLLVNNDFDQITFSKEIHETFENDIFKMFPVAQKKKVVIYFASKSKMEIGISTDETSLSRDLVGSEIMDLEQCILLINDTNPKNRELLTRLSVSRPDYLNLSKRDKYIDNMIERFMYEFENCSSAHARSDGYRFYFFYNIALHILVQLEALKQGVDSFNFFPKNLTSKILTSEKDQKEIYSLNGSIHLPDGNSKKRMLLNRFISTVDGLIPKEKLSSVSEFCKFIYSRDKIWGFRDLGTNHPKISFGKVFRSAVLSIYQESDDLSNLLHEHSITTIIDLRADTEKGNEVLRYSPGILESVNYVSAPMNPFNQPEWFRKEHQQGTNPEIAYRFFVMCCQDAIVKTIRTISETEGAVVMHCHAGKDRTGIIAAILGLLVGENSENILQDYLASESDTSPKLLQIVLDHISEKGGIENYLLEAGMTNEEINAVKEKLTKR